MIILTKRVYKFQHFNTIYQIQIQSMNDLDNTKQFLDAYLYKPDQPIISTSSFSVHHAVQKQTKLPVTIKILRGGYSPDILRYLKKMKDCRSQNTIRIFEIFQNSSQILLVTEHANYGNLSNALGRCQRLQESDAIYISKLLLNGYVDLLRVDCKWIGTENDIEFTQSGIKLSWNNYNNLKAEDCISKVIQKISFKRENKQSLIPFPKSKTIEELLKVSKQSASEISLNPHMKKKDKLSKKKGRDWLGLREVNLKNEYYEQTVYLAVSKQYGFIRVKVFEQGTIDKNLLTLNKTKGAFTRIIDTYDQNNRTIIISQYSNDGTLQSYINRLKNSNIKLNQEHIEFFFFSFFDPLKDVQESSIKSIGMFNIRNIFIENGIPKIGEPIPMNSKIETTLKNRVDVPDFFHTNFKKQPTQKSQLFDTYSLGVLLYKLMYTQYPIFPQGKVHIPTAPNYNKRLKTSLQILLNQGGTLKSLESKIQISDAVRNQIKQNKALINTKIEKNISTSTKRALIFEIQSEVQLEKQTQIQQEQDQAPDDELGCCGLFCASLELTANQKGANRFVRITALQESPYKIYRICTKILLILLLYILILHLFYIKTATNFLGSAKNIVSHNITIGTYNYSIMIDNLVGFETSFNKTSKNLNSLVNLNCFIDDYNGSPKFSSYLIQSPSGWLFFVISSLICLCIFTILKGWQIYRFDIVKAIYNWDHSINNFNMTNYIVFNLLFTSLLHSHYYLFNFLFTGNIEPCIGTSYLYSSTFNFFNNEKKFLFPYMTTFLLQCFVLFFHWFAILLSHKIPYNKLVNPIIFICPLLITQWLIIRIGLINDYFLPNGLQSNQTIRDYFTNLSYINIVGTVPEMLFVCQLLLSVVVDSVYWCFLEKRRRLIIQETSHGSIQEFMK